MARVLIALGSNLGDRSDLLDKSVRMIAGLAATSVEGVSQWYSTKAVGGPANQPEFLNGAMRLATTLDPLRLLDALRGVENSLGRRRRIRWDSRTIDIDLLLYEDLRLESDRITLPHPRMAFRRFVLEPAVEIAGDWVHPVIHWSLAKLLEHLKTCPPRFALCGFAVLGLRPIASQVQTRLDCEAIFDRPEPIESDWSLANLDRQLQCVSRRASLLANSSWNTATVPVIADFLIEESNLLYRTRPGIADSTLTRSVSEDTRYGPRSRFGLVSVQAASGIAGIETRPTIEKLADAVSPPKLLIVPQPISAEPQSPAEWFSYNLCHYVMESRIAPVLKIPSENPAAAVDEITAAIEAMK